MQCLVAYMYFFLMYLMLFIIFYSIVCNYDEHLPADALHAMQALESHWKSKLSMLSCLYCLMTPFDIHSTVILYSVYSDLYLFCSFTAFVQTSCYDDAEASFTSCNYSLKYWRVHCCSNAAIFELYCVSIHAMVSLVLSVEESTALL